ncbi:MAG: hypothetical protein SVV80_11990 [Planctomycetota bacterium]|nr:hypothetical protein [Planctomycetota bacterium]
MTSKKDGKSLFEVMKTGESQGGKSLDVPSWFERGGRKTPRKDASGEAPKVPPPLSRPSGPEVHHERILSVSSGRLVISLNQISAVVVVLAIILLGVGAYLLGRRTAQNAAASPDRITAPSKPRATRPGAETVKVLPVPDSPAHGRGASGMVSDDAQRQKGYTYLVIQGGIQTLKEAKDIKQFLYDKGINATIHRMRHTQGYMVKDMKGFSEIRSSQTRAEIRERVSQIERLGKLYQRRGGRYDFKQSSSTVPWMETEN